MAHTKLMSSSYPSRLFSPSDARLSARFATFADPPAGVFDSLRDPVERQAALCLWERETGLAERAWLHRTCALGDIESARSWLFSDEALSGAFGLCPENAPGRVWDRLARASGARRVFNLQNPVGGDERCVARAIAIGAEALFPKARRDRLRVRLWIQALDDLRQAGKAQPNPRDLAWPAPPKAMEIWLLACGARASESQMGAGLLCSLQAQSHLDRLGLGEAAF